MWNSLQKGIQCQFKQITSGEGTSQFRISFIFSKLMMNETMKETEGI